MNNEKVLKHINIALEDFFKKDCEITSFEYDIQVAEDFEITSLIYIDGFYINKKMEVVEIRAIYHIKNNEIFFRRMIKK